MSRSVNSDPQTSPASVKPDISSVITQTIGRQLHNVASFLAPPPQQPYSYPPPPPPPPPRSDVSSPSSYEGFKNDLAEIGDSLKTLLSPKKAVTGISKFASNLFQFDKKGILDPVDAAVGVTDDVVDFVRVVSVRPQCWVEFPLSLQHKDFSMSQVQKDHAIVIQDLVPNLAALRRTIHNVMSEQQFWMIYFILLVPQLNQDDCRLLSTPEILQMHEALLQKLRNKNSPIVAEDTPDEKGSMVNVTKIESSISTDNAANTTKYKNHASDVCFSDIEDGEFKQTQSSRVSSASENSDWVRIGGTSKANRSRYRGRQSESEESSSDWHAVEDVDL